VNWELELFDTQPAQTGGLDREFIFGGRLDDKLCSWAAAKALINSLDPKSAVAKDVSSTTADNSIKVCALFDDEEIGSLLRQGARGNFLPGTISRINASLKRPSSLASSNLEALTAQTFANSFLVSSDVTHAVNPNFLNIYLENHAPELNVGITISADSNGHMTTDSVSTAFLQQVAEHCDSKLQVFQIRNDSRSGGTVGPMLSSAMGCRAVDAGIPQLSMHSIRATTGSLDPGLGVKLFQGFYEAFEHVNAEFKE
jgi:aminopeptidase I